MPHTRENYFQIKTVHHWGLALIKRLFWYIPLIMLGQMRLQQRMEKWVVSGPYWLEILHLEISKLTDASHKGKLFSDQNCAPLRPCINKKAILVCSTYYIRSDAFATKDGKSELLLSLTLLSLLLLCYILLTKFETLPLPSPKAATCKQYRAFFKVLTV